MTSKNYRQLLNNEFESKEMTKEDFDNTLMYFATLYHAEQTKQQFCGDCENYAEWDTGIKWCSVCGNKLS